MGEVQSYDEMFGRLTAACPPRGGSGTGATAGATTQGGAASSAASSGSAETGAGAEREGGWQRVNDADLFSSNIVLPDKASIEVVAYSRFGTSKQGRIEGIPDDAIGKPTLVLGTAKEGFTIDTELGGLFSEAKGIVEGFGISMSKNAVADMGMVFGPMSGDEIRTLAGDRDFTAALRDTVMGIACRGSQKDERLLSKMLSAMRIRGRVGFVMVMVNTLHGQGSYLNPCANSSEAMEQVDFMRQLVQYSPVEAPVAETKSPQDSSSAMVISGQNADSLMLFGSLKKLEQFANKEASWSPEILRNLLKVFDINLRMIEAAEIKGTDKASVIALMKVITGSASDSGEMATLLLEAGACYGRPAMHTDPEDTERIWVRMDKLNAHYKFLPVAPNKNFKAMLDTVKEKVPREVTNRIGNTFLLMAQVTFIVLAKNRSEILADTPRGTLDLSALSEEASSNLRLMREGINPVDFKQMMASVAKYEARIRREEGRGSSGPERAEKMQITQQMQGASGAAVAAAAGGAGTSGPAGSPPNGSTIIFGCIDFMRGICTRGVACRNEHSDQAKCPRGATCPYLSKQAGCFFKGPNSH